MGRRPDVDPDLIKEVLAGEPGSKRPNSTEAAEVLANLIDHPVAAGLVRGAINRHPEWGVPTGLEGRPPAMDYAVERDLGPIRRDHKKSHHLKKLRAYERMVAKGTTEDAKGAWPVKVLDYVGYRLSTGRVTAYDRDLAAGWYTRMALPWEMGHYYAQRVPVRARDILREYREYDRPMIYTLAGERTLDIPVTDDHRAFWELTFKALIQG